MEWVDEDFVSASHKYVDDLTTTKSITHDANSGRREEKDSSYTNLFHAVESQMNLESLSQVCNRKGLKVNEKKMQLLAISADRDRAGVYMEVEGE